MQGLRKVATSLVRIVCRAGVSLWLAYTSDVPRVRRGGCLAAGTQSYILASPGCLHDPR